MMKIQVNVHSKSRMDKIEKIDESHWRIETCAPAYDNKANERVIEMVAKELDIAKSRLKISKGQKSKIKELEILG